MARLRPIWRDRNISLKSKVRLLRALVISIFLYASPKRWLMTGRDGGRQCAQPLGAPTTTPGQGTGKTDTKWKSKWSVFDDFHKFPSADTPRLHLGNQCKPAKTWDFLARVDRFPQRKSGFLPSADWLCKVAGWRVCVPLNGKVGQMEVSGTCVVCKVLKQGVAPVSPFPFLAGARHVAIRGHPFHVLSANSLAPLENSVVLMLTLVEAKITDVKNNTFTGFSSLQTLSLTSNKLTNVRSTWFTGLKNLMSLTLSNNRIKQIEPGSFAKLTRLFILDLENNLLQIVEPGWLFGLKSIMVMNLGLNKIKSISPTSFQHIQPTWIDLSGNDLWSLDEDVFRGQSRLRSLHISSGMLPSAHDARPHDMMWSLYRLADAMTRSATLVVAVPRFLFCVSQHGVPTELSFWWVFDPSNNMLYDIVPKSFACDILHRSLSTISIQTPVVVLATDDSLTEKLETNTLEQCRQVWEYDGGITMGLVRRSTFRLVSLSKANATFEGVGMSFVQTQDTNTLTTTESGYVAGLVLPPLVVLVKKLCSTGTCEDERDSNDAHVWTVPLGAAFPDLLRSASLPACSGRMASDDVVSCRLMPAVLHSVQPTYSQIPDGLACAQRPLPSLPHEDVISGVVRSASLPARTRGPGDASDDAASCRSLPAVLQSIEPIYSEIPDHMATAQRPLPPLPCTSREMSEQEAAAQCSLSVPAHTYSVILDEEESDPVPFSANPAGFSLHVITNSWQTRRAFLDVTTTSNRHRSGRSITTYGLVEQNIAQCNNIYRKALLEFQGIRARRNLRTGLVSQDTDQSVRTYANVTDGILSRGQEVTEAHIAFLTSPGVSGSWKFSGDVPRITPRRTSFPFVTIPNTYWPCEIPGDCTHFTLRRVSLSTATLPNTSRPWGIPGEGTRNTARCASLPTVTLPNTYWPWEVPGEETRNTRRRASLPTVTLPNTYWPWEVPGEGTRNTRRRASLPTVTLPNTYWPWEVPGEGTRNTRRRASLPTIPGKGTRNTRRRTSLPTVTLPNTYWPWEVPGEGTRNTRRRASLPTILPRQGSVARYSIPLQPTLPFWPQKLTPERREKPVLRGAFKPQLDRAGSDGGTVYSKLNSRRVQHPWPSGDDLIIVVSPLHAIMKGQRDKLSSMGLKTTCLSLGRMLPTATLPNTYWPWEVPGNETCNTP
ncbi:hypothetical protein Bbelb_406720 [Branchiostoma belcheri]|nr:hypothetical protein Bbelb_406720 [Branchiostoma belcheri]